MATDVADPPHLCGIGPRMPVDIKPTDALAPSVQWWSAQNPCSFSDRQILSRCS